MSSLPAAAHGDPLSLLSSAALESATGKLGPGSGMKTRRLSASTTTTSHRRRMSDARDRPSVKIISPSLKPKTPALISALAKAPAPALADGDLPGSPSSPGFKNPDLSGGSGGISGRRKGTIFRCESCSKVYRHPSCLIKHRWEHSPHWAESSKLLLSKHQQVQLLEGAAILSNFQVGSLPEDRALWPTWATNAAASLPSSTGMLDAIAGGMEGSAVDDSDDEDNDEDARPRSRSMGAAAALKRRPVKAGFTPPAHAKLTQVAPGVLLAPSSSSVPIKQHQTRSRGAPSSSPVPVPVEVRPGMLVVGNGSEPIAIKREAAVAASTSPTSALDALASLTLSLSSSYSASYARSSVRSGSEEDPELPELDEHPEDEVMVDRKEEVWDGMELDLDEMEM